MDSPDTTTPFKSRRKAKRNSGDDNAILRTFKRKTISFEANPNKRRVHRLRLVKKLENIIDEYCIKIGQQAVVTFTDQESRCHVYGSKPLQNVVKKFEDVIAMNLKDEIDKQKIEIEDDQHTNDVDPNLFDLPSLIIDGEEIPVDSMTQTQLRCFIPLMLKFSTGRGKAGWGKSETRPAWWPEELPWANVRVDTRTDEMKSKMTWTEALRQVVKSCYKFHGREDLLPTVQNIAVGQKYQNIYENHNNNNVTENNHNNNLDVYEQVINPDGTVSMVQINSSTALLDEEEEVVDAEHDEKQVILTGVNDQGQTVTLTGYVSPVLVASIKSSRDGVVFLIPVTDDDNNDNLNDVDTESGQTDSKFDVYSLKDDCVLLND